MNDLELRKNREGYNDPTAYEAIKNIEREQDKFTKLLHTIFNICDLAGFKIGNRIVLVDKKTGRTWE